MTVVGKGETAFSITLRTGVGRFVAHVLSTAPKSALEGAKLAFEAERLSPLQIRDNKKNFNTDFVAFLTTIFEEGRGVAGT
uniref:Uncharacterized protein n=1 Tax=Phytophthora fragariae TaxID=53985 RepID=A0A6A3ENU1_9STRA|nr:hypothetical protein PF009_g15815 [Phytophthora fragariae]